MTETKPVLIADAGYYYGTTEKPLNFYIPYDGARQVNYSLGDYGAGGTSASGMLPAGMVANGWHHVAVVEQNKKIRLYVDYVQYGEVAVTSTQTLDSKGGTVPANVRDLVLGNYLQHCKISCVRVMKRALEPDEFMYASNLPTCVPRTVFQWSLDNKDPSPSTNIVSTYAAANPDLYISKASTFTGEGTPSAAEVPIFGLVDACRYARCDVINGDAGRRLDECCMYFNSPDVSPAASSVYRTGSDIRIAADEGAEFSKTSPFTAEAFFKFDRTEWLKSTSQYSKPPYDRVILMSRIATSGESRVAWSVALVNAATPEDTELELTSSWGSGSASEGSGSGKFGDGKWHHVAVTYDPTLRKMCAYFDYQLVSEVSLGGAVDCGTTGYISIGTGPAAEGHNFMGWVDEVRYSRVALQPSQFLKLENHRGASLLFH